MEGPFTLQRQTFNLFFFCKLFSYFFMGGWGCDGSLGFKTRKGNFVFLELDRPWDRLVVLGVSQNYSYKIKIMIRHHAPISKSWTLPLYFSIYPRKLVIVGNTHLFFKPDADHIRLLQFEKCLTEIQILRNTFNKYNFIHQLNFKLTWLKVVYPVFQNLSKINLQFIKVIKYKPFLRYSTVKSDNL